MVTVVPLVVTFIYESLRGTQRKSKTAFREGPALSTVGSDTNAEECL